MGSILTSLLYELGWHVIHLYIILFLNIFSFLLCKMNTRSNFGFSQTLLRLVSSVKTKNKQTKPKELYLSYWGTLLNFMFYRLYNFPCCQFLPAEVIILAVTSLELNGGDREKTWAPNIIFHEVNLLHGEESRRTGWATFLSPSGIFKVFLNLHVGIWDS